MFSAACSPLAQSCSLGRSCWKDTRASWDECSSMFSENSLVGGGCESRRGFLSYRFRLLLAHASDPAAVSPALNTGCSHVHVLTVSAARSSEWLPDFLTAVSAD